MATRQVLGALAAVAFFVAAAWFAPARLDTIVLLGLGLWALATTI